MEPMIESLKNFVKQSHSGKPSIKKFPETKSEYVITWERNGGDEILITSYTLNFKFDIDSFLIRYNELYPQHQIGESFVMTGISYLFTDVADLVLKWGRQGYDELAQKLYQKRGSIMGTINGI